MAAEDHAREEGAKPRRASERSDQRAASHRAADWLARHAGLVLILALLATAGLAVPLIFLPPTTTASQEPGGPVFWARDRADERFATDVHRVVFVVEARRDSCLLRPPAPPDCNLLARAPLLELRRNLHTLRRHPELGPKLYAYRDPRLGRRIRGGVTVVDAVEGVLRSLGVDGLAAASEEQVGRAVGLLLSARKPSELGLAASTRRKGGAWTSPAATIAILANNQALGGGGSSTTLGSGNLEKERFGRRVQEVLRGGQRHSDVGRSAPERGGASPLPSALGVWGLAMDVNLTSQEQGTAAGPYVGMTIFAVLLLVGLTFRSYWVVAITGFSLAALVIWLKGLSNLLGLKTDQILTVIVPIAMISFGVDFAFHAVGRYREEQARTADPRRALVLGLAGVMGALLLALFSDTAAFLANATSSIEALVQFGIGAALALVAAYVMLGVVTPLALMRVERIVGVGRRGSALRRLLALSGAVGAALAAMGCVSVTAFVEPWIGAAMTGGYLVLLLLLPVMVVVRLAPAGADEPSPGTERSTSMARLAGGAVAWLVRFRILVLLVAAVVTGTSVYLASRIEVRFEVEDFFSVDADFVVGLRKFQRHVGQQGGEPAFVYVETDLTRPRAVLALRRFAEQLRGLSTGRLARDRSGVRIDRGVLEVIEAVMRRPAARVAVAAASGTAITDADDDGIPDAPAQLAGLYGFAQRAGVPADRRQLILRPDRVQSVLWHRPGEALSSTRIGVWLPGTSSQENTRLARGDVEPLLEKLREALLAVSPRSRVELTGRPIVRQASLDAVFRAFLTSLPVAVTLCLVIAVVFMRSFRYAAVSIVPILLVVVWLYGLMYLLGYSINVVTATIGAISIGVGIDFAVHFTMRFREELARVRAEGRGGAPPRGGAERPTTTNRLEAMRRAGAGTGVALLASAASSVVGFSILAFAPMPMFAAYGVLTAVMVLLAATASLGVLPSLLMLVTRER
jgi:predicted RND superfamily exporter protein